MSGSRSRFQYQALSSEASFDPRSVQPNEIDAMLSNLDELITGIDLVEYENDLAYVGFNPMNVVANVLTRIRRDPELGQRALITSLVFACTRGFGKGKSWQNITSRMSQNGREKLMEARDFFGIELSSGIGKPSSFINFSRLLAAFPKVIAPNYNGSLPIAFQFPGSPAVMNEQCYRQYRQEYVTYMMCLTQLWKAEQDIQTCQQWADVAYGSPMLKPNRRVDANYTLTVTTPNVEVVNDELRDEEIQTGQQQLHITGQRPLVGDSSHGSDVTSQQNLSQQRLQSHQPQHRDHPSSSREPNNPGIQQTQTRGFNITDLDPNPQIPVSRGRGAATQPGAGRGMGAPGDQQPRS